MTRPQASILSRLVQWSAADRRRYSTRRSENALAGVSDRGSGGIWKISRVSAPPGPRKTALCLLCKSVESRPCPPCSHDLSLSPAELAITSYQFSPCLPSRGPADWIGDSSLGAEQHVCRIIRHRLELSPCSLQWAPWPWVGPLQSPPSLGPPSSPEQTATVHLPTWYRTSNRTSGKYMSDWPLGSHSRPHSRQAPARLLQRSFFTRRTLRPFGVCFRSWTSKMDTLPLPPCECEQRGFPGNLAFPQNPTETVGAWLRGSRGPSLAMLPSSARPNEYFSGVLVQIPAGQVSCRVRCQPCTVASARTQTGNSQLICCPYLLPAM